MQMLDMLAMNARHHLFAVFARQQLKPVLLSCSFQAISQEICPAQSIMLMYDLMELLLTSHVNC